MWNGNLAVFFLCLIALPFALATGWYLTASGLLLVMAVCYALGLRILHIPSAHLDEFSQALAHGEILLMVDVPLHRVRAVEDLVHRHHPEATVGGVGWSMEAFGL